MKTKSRISTLIVFLLLAACSAKSVSTYEGRRDRDESARAALENLYRSSPAAKALGSKANAVLVFPEIVKGGFVYGGQYGEGVLYKEGYVDGYYKSISASFGLQAGLQKFGYALFFMTDDDVDYLKNSEGWEIGVGPNVTILDEGLARSLSTTTLRKGIYAFFFEQRGLMAGLGLQGTRISKIEK